MTDEKGGKPPKPPVIPFPDYAEREFAKLRKERDANKPKPPPVKRARKRVEATELVIGKALREELELFEGRLFKLDTFSGQTLLMHPVPAGILPPQDFKPRAATDVDITHMMMWLQANNFTKSSVPRVSRSIDVEADRNRFSAAKLAFEALPSWDGERRLDHFWIDVCGVVPAEQGMNKQEIDKRWSYLSATARCFFISIVARVFKPGCKADFSPVLEGTQGTKKSMLLRIMALNDEWFSDCMPRDLGNKDARSHLAGKLIVELAEMHQMKATQVDTLKGFLTVQEDKFRPSYGRLDIILKRQCVFVGTTNSNAYFRDETGNRRFWPIPCGEINVDLAREIMPQIYAEAKQAFFNGEHWWLPPEVEALAEVEQDNRITDDPWEEGVTTVVSDARTVARMRGETFFYVTSIQGLQAIESKRELWDQGKQHRVALILRKLGGKNMRLPRDGGEQKRGFRFISEPFE